jgi:hypothetical protein
LAKRDESGTYCVWCGIFFDSIVETRKHHFAEHYEYCLAQCSNDMEIVQDWMNSREPNEKD